MMVSFKHPTLWLLLALLSGCQMLQALAPGQTPSKQAITPSKNWRVKPGSVHDGDTFRAIAGGEEIRVRLSCLDAPELKQAHGKESRSYLRQLLPDGAPIRLQVSDKDRYGRQVAEVFVVKGPGQEIAVNGEMIAKGQAFFYPQYRKACPKSAERYEQLEQMAQKKRLGVWKDGQVIKPWNWRKQQRTSLLSPSRLAGN
jgi:endonuclease YncB( thermonuclease family)